MAGKRRHGDISNLDERRRRKGEDDLAEANRQMIEAEHALFVALRLAGHRGPGNVANNRGRRSAPTIVPLSRARNRRKAA